MTTLLTPLNSLKLGQWFKLICGASYQDVAAIRNLSLIYSLAGADCIDVAADLAVVHAARLGMDSYQTVARDSLQRPWLMVSLNDGRDPHFRKAWFDGQICPIDCARPCEQVCPADAILPIAQSELRVVGERCYGCGRCLPICPSGLIQEQAFTISARKILPLIIAEIDAIEIHTQIGRQQEFQQLWQQLSPYIGQLKLVSVSCPDPQPNGNAIVDYLMGLYQLMTPKPSQLLWQTDGRPMSGDIGKGTTRATIKLAQKVLNARLPGYVQLAGGTNNYTVPKLRSLNLLKSWPASGDAPRPRSSFISGIAYGSYARQLVNPGEGHLENTPEKLWQQVNLAQKLVRQIKPNGADRPNISQISKPPQPPISGSIVPIPP